MRVEGLGFRVWGLGFRVLGLGFRVWGLGFGVWGLGFGVWGWGSGALGAKRLKGSEDFPAGLGFRGLGDRVDQPSTLKPKIDSEPRFLSRKRSGKPEPLGF